MGFLIKSINDDYAASSQQQVQRTTRNIYRKITDKATGIVSTTGNRSRTTFPGMQRAHQLSMEITGKGEEKFKRRFHDDLVRCFRIV
ncbi:hypothetical protein [Fictibacillus terranigra]|uniref:Uncharacterized protein n=1 Tax=Fictibacillus terranigra TaxID=3058424 RepID=A0ABT8EC17_9BACL|nr:hypothetical protein [Fictibacillus sp. CENA-BCM004]MDN4075466.1 hypothetical protein [Fictibacillus sp. CENA-BCM004]